MLQDVLAWDNALVTIFNVAVNHLGIGAMLHRAGSNQLSRVLGLAGWKP